MNDPVLTPPHRPGVYAIAGVPGYIKIGRASNIAKRMQDVQCGHPVTLRLVAVLSWDPSDEDSFHAQWAALRTVGEWFVETPELLAFLASRDALPPEPMPAEPVGPIPLAAFDYERAADAFRVCKQTWGHIGRIPNAADIEDLIRWKQTRGARRGLARITHGIVLEFGGDGPVTVTLGERLAAAYARSTVRQALRRAPAVPEADSRADRLERAREWIAAKRAKPLQGVHQ